MRCGAVIPAAGASQRMGDADKTSVRLAGRAVLDWVLDALLEAAVCREVVIVIAEGNERRIAATLSARHDDIPIRLCRGGATRQVSVARGVAALSEDVDLVLIHDLARPLIRPATIGEGVARAREWGAVVAAVPVVDTIKQVDASGVIRATPPRDALWAAQTPQVFRRDWLRRAYERAEGDTAATDEASLLERAGFEVRVYPGDPENIKLTSPVDLIVAEAVLRARRGGAA